MNKVLKKVNTWFEPISDWWFFHWEEVLLIGSIILFAVGMVVLALWSNGAFYDEVENYDFTAQVYDKDHYTTTSLIKSGDSRIPVTHHHYKIMWEDGKERGVFEIGEDHYDLIKIGDFVNVHCSVKADKQGELHYYYSFKGY
jgi:hypothetical protein